MIDGEVVHVDKSGRESFTGSQRRCSTEDPLPSLIREFPVKYKVWDCLAYKGVNIETEPLLERKRKLKSLFWKILDERFETIQFETEMYCLQVAWQKAIDQDREGIIVKDSKSGYEHKRSWKWRKVKNWKWEKLHVCGYTPGLRARSSFFGALVLENEAGQFRGLAGSGFNEADLMRFKYLFMDAPDMVKPFSDSQVGSHYTAKKVKTEVLIKYYQTTDSQVMRFPIFSMG